MVKLKYLVCFFFLFFFGGNPRGADPVWMGPLCETKRCPMGGMMDFIGPAILTALLCALDI